MSTRVTLEANLTPALLEEALPLVRAMHEEVMGVPLPGLNIDMLGNAATAGVLRVVFARDDAKMIGFMVLFVGPNLLGRKQVTINQTYLSPAYRGLGHNTAVDMFQLAKSFASGAGAQLLAMARGTTAADFFVGLGGVPAELLLEFPE